MLVVWGMSFTFHHFVKWQQQMMKLSSIESTASGWSNPSVLQEIDSFLNLAKVLDDAMNYLVSEGFRACWREEWVQRLVAYINSELKPVWGKCRTKHGSVEDMFMSLQTLLRMLWGLRCSRNGYGCLPLSTASLMVRSPSWENFFLE